VGRRIADEIVDLGRRVGRVERQEGGADAQAGKVEDDRLGRLLDLCRDPVSDHHTLVAQHVRIACGKSECLPIEYHTAIGGPHEGCIQIGNPRENLGEQVMRHDFSETDG
jgi:hypothetical protein